VLRAFLFSLLFAATPLPSQALQLADGQTLLGKVEDADENGCRVRRLDNGGVLELRWDHLSPASAMPIKRAWNLVSASEDEVLVRANEVVYMHNGTRQRVIGRVSNEDGADYLTVTTKGVQVRVPKTELREMPSVEVPATQVYTMDEYYTMRLAEVQPGQSADKHMLFAEELIKVRDYDHAGYHLNQAKELGNTAQPGQLADLQARLQRYKEAREERELLDQIVAARSRGKLADFQRGEKFIAQFEKSFPQSKLRNDFETEKKRFAESRKRYLSQQVADNWRRSIQIFADKKVADAGFSLQQAREYAENKMTDDIVARLAEQFTIAPDEVKELWSIRESYPVGKRSELFTYGVGSWVLGEAAILKGTKVGAVKAQQQPEVDASQDRAVERVRRAMEEAMRRRQAQGAGGQQGQGEQTEDDWWKDATRVERTGWLRAYYAEFGGQLVLTYQSVAPCISCYGQGTTPEMSPDGKMMQVKCFLCQGTKWLRSFRAY
jgi:hypothetical protein